MKAIYNVLFYVLIILGVSVGTLCYLLERLNNCLFTLVERVEDKL